MCIAVSIHPGYTGLRELRDTNDEEADLVVNVVGQQWVWNFEYADTGVKTTTDLYLPVDQLIRFDITARDEDVVHSFWIPAFRIKIDAVPGLATSVDVRPNLVGEYDEDVNLRVQCAELCGINHFKMFSRVHVLEQEAFDDWLSEAASRVSGQEGSPEL